jgi:metallo-beta-lactamase family protein
MRSNAPGNPLFTLHHHGAVQGVTGSCHELRICAPRHPPEHSAGAALAPQGPNSLPTPDAAAAILVDCGLFQGAETSGSGVGPADPRIDFPVEHIRALVLTHVHIDHCGRVPYLLAAGFQGPIYCSEPSAVLLPLVIEDALAVGATRDPRLIDRTLRVLEDRLRPLPYGRWQKISLGAQADLPTLEIRLQPAGHILGSAYLECRITASPPKAAAGASGRPTATVNANTSPEPASRHRIVFSGDLGASDTPLLPEPTPPTGCDTLVIESTYGDALHEDRARRVQRLQDVIERSLRDRGAVLIPAFSIGRTQELLYEIEDIIHRNRGREATRGLPWDELEIVVDSPLAARFTRVYERLRGHWDDEARARRREGRHPLSFEQLRTVDSHADHLRIVQHLQKTRYPAIVLAASGMCAGGRIVNYLKALVGDERTDIVFVGYQAAGTPGRVIQQHGPAGGWVELDGERYAIRAGVHTLGGYSAHADQADLLRFVRGMRRPPRAVRVVHGDDDAKRAFAATLQQQLPEAEILLPGYEGADHPAAASQ